jgi:hypothetical protein
VVKISPTRLASDTESGSSRRDLGSVDLALAEGAIQVDAALIADGLGLEPSHVLHALRDGALTALCEQGIAADAGRFRLTFFQAGRRLRILVDRDGRILEQSTTRVHRRGPAA